jgi:uncharacterized radical SAM superfamily Fe-S cluster-containing enzyme
MENKCLSFCHECNEIRQAYRHLEGNSVELEIICPIHGSQFGILNLNKDFYVKLKEIVSDIDEKIEIKNIPDIINYCNTKYKTSKVSSIHINFTEKCNLRCKNCFASSESSNNLVEKENSVENIINNLSKYEKQRIKPMIVIIGGEPTLREDLSELICKLNQLGYNTRLSTNGILLENKNYFKKLSDNGLDWILLQFDGFNSKTSLNFRGADLLEKKQNVLKIATELDIKIHLIVMVSKEQNINECLDIIRYAFEHNNIFAVNFYPESLTGRHEKLSTSVFDIIQNLEIQSNGTISLQDFYKMKKIWQYFSRFFRNPLLEQNICTFPMFLFRRNEDIYPINRLFSISHILKYPINSLKNIIRLYQILRWKIKPNKNFLYFNIEKFYNSDSFDLQEAMNCHNVYLTNKGLIPLCIYNSIFRLKNCL